MLIPTIDQVGELRDLETLKVDILAGVTVALVLVPQSMAYAQLAGLPPYYGLYASFLPPMIAAIFGSSRQLATGPVAVVSLMTAASLEPKLVRIDAGVPQLVNGEDRLSHDRHDEGTDSRGSHLGDQVSVTGEEELRADPVLAVASVRLDDLEDDGLSAMSMPVATTFAFRGSLLNCSSSSSVYPRRSFIISQMSSGTASLAMASSSELPRLT